MKLIAFNSARAIVTNYDNSELKNMGGADLVRFCDKDTIDRAATQSQINTVIDSSAYNVIINDVQFISTLETQIKTLINTRKIY